MDYEIQKTLSWYRGFDFCSDIKKTQNLSKYTQFSVAVKGKKAFVSSAWATAYKTQSHFFFFFVEHHLEYINIFSLYNLFLTQYVYISSEITILAQAETAVKSYP